MSSWLSIFYFGTFFRVALNDFMCILTTGPSSSWNYSSMLFIYLTFLLCSFCSHISLRNCFAPFAFSCRYVIMYFPPTSWRNVLSLFWVVLSYFIALPCLCVFQIALRFSLSFDLSLPAALLDLSVVVLVFWSERVPVSFPSLALSVVVKYSSLVRSFFKSARLNQSCCQLVYLVIAC